MGRRLYGRTGVQQLPELNVRPLSPRDRCMQRSRPRQRAQAQSPVQDQRHHRLRERRVRSGPSRLPTETGSRFERRRVCVYERRKCVLHLDPFLPWHLLSKRARLIRAGQFDPLATPRVIDARSLNAAVDEARTPEALADRAVELDLLANAGRAQKVGKQTRAFLHHHRLPTNVEREICGP